MTKETDIDFATSSPNPSLFPYQDFQLCINQAIQKYQAELFLYGTARGLNGLIDVSVKSLMKDQIFTKAKNLVITSGVQQALSLLIDMPFPSGKDTILVEQPTYHLFLDQLQTLGKSVSYIERTHQGIDLEKLEKIFATENIKFFYTMPRFHNPLAVPWQIIKNKALWTWLINMMFILLKMTFYLTMKPTQRPTHFSHTIPSEGTPST